MPPLAKKRHKLALEPISIDELYDSSTMKGLLTFMEPLPSVVRIKPSGDISHESSPDISIKPSPDISHGAVPPYRGRLFPLRKGSDALIPEEQLLYQYMWNNGNPVAHTGMVRTFTGSLSLLTKEIKRGDDRSTKRVVDTLIRKMAISIARRESHNHLIPRTYYVFHWNEIQARHKSQGWTWAIKNRGIQLLNEEQARRIQQVQKQRKKEKPELGPTDLGPLAPLNIFFHASGDTSDQPSGDSSYQVWGEPDDNRGEVSGDNFTLYPNKTSEERQLGEGNTTTADIAALVALLQQALGHADDDAARRIIIGCRQEAPTAPLEHILHFTGLTAQRMRAMKTVTNPMGLVIRHTPRHFCGEAYTQFAAEDVRRQTDEQERQRRMQNELLTDARKILANPQSTPEDRAFAQDILAEAGSSDGAEK